MTNHKNDVHCMSGVTRSGRTFGNMVMDVKKTPNKRGVEEQEVGKRKRIEKSNHEVSIPNEPNIRKSKEVGEMVESEEKTKTVE